MPITIKKYNRQVDPVTPNVPDPINPGAVRAAFGENVYQANQQIGQQISNIGEMLGKYAQIKKKQEDDAWQTSAETKYRLELNQRKFDDTPETVNKNGTDVTRPSGWFSRKFDLADNVVVDARTWHKSKRDELLASAPNKDVAAALSQRLDNLYLSTDDDLVKYEVKQRDASLVRTHVSSLSQKTHDASAIRDIGSLSTAVRDGILDQEKISFYNEDDPQEAETLKKGSAGDIVFNAVSGTLLETKDIKMATDLLNSQRGNIQEDRYVRIREYLENKDKEIKRVDKEAIAESHDSYKASLQDKLLYGELTEIDLERAKIIPKEQGGLKDTEITSLREALYKFRDKSITDIEEKYPRAQQYIDVVEKYSDNISDQYKAKDIIIKAWADGRAYPDELVKLDKLKKLVNDYNWTKKNGFWIDSYKSIKSFFGDSPKDKDALAGAIHELVDRTLEGEDPKASIIKIQRKERLKKNPWMANVPLTGEVRILKDGSKVKVFPDGNVEAVK